MGDNIIKYEIKKELIKLGYNMSNKGTIYLIDSIQFIYESNNYMKITSNLEKNVYKIIANKYKTNPATLKSNIVKATNNMIAMRNEKNNLNRYLKITPKVVIQEILYKISNGQYV